MANISNIRVNGVVHNIVDDEAMRLADNPTTNDILIVDSTGQAIDSGKSLEDYQEVLTGGNGIDITNNTVSSKFENLPSGTDLDDVKYTYVGYTPTPVNGPPSYLSGMLLTVASDTGNNVMQLHHYYNGDRLYVRYYREATGWHDWFKVLTGTRETLWSNASPTSSFSAQTISLDLSGYQYVYILFRQSTGSSTIYSSELVVPFNYEHDAIAILAGTSTVYKRSFTVGSSGIVFGGGKSGTTDDDSKMIPRSVYGIR